MSNIDKAIDTTGKVLELGDYKKWYSLILSFVILTTFIIILLFVIRKWGGNELGNIWDFISNPFKNLKAKINAQKTIDKYQIEPTLKGDEPRQVADSLYSCFQAGGDDEEGFYSICRNRIGNVVDWELVKGEFGSRVSPKPGNIFGVKHSCTLEAMILDNFNDKEAQTVRDILKGKGITNLNF